MPAAPHLHLPEPVLRHDVALGEEQVIVVLRIDVRDAGLVSQYLDRFPQPRDRQFAVDLSQRQASQLIE